MIELFGKKYYPCFRAGKYQLPQGTFEFTVAQLQRIAQIYSPKFVHDAPIWIGHPDLSSITLGKEEPEAVGWIESLTVVDDLLYFSTSSVSDYLIYLTDQKFYKYVSVEFVNYLIADKPERYFHAIGLTNRPAVEGLGPVGFSPEDAQHNFNIKFTDRITFESENFPNQKNKNTMNPKLIALAAAMGLKAEDYKTDDLLIDAVNTKFTEINAERIAFSNQVTELKAKAPVTEETDPKIIALNKQIQDLQFANCEAEVNHAIDAKKILPAQKDLFLKFAKADLEACKKLFTDLPENTLFTKRQVKEGEQAKEINTTDAKFLKDGRKLTFAEIQKDKELFASFTQPELEQLILDERNNK